MVGATGNFDNVRNGQGVLVSGNIAQRFLQLLVADCTLAVDRPNIRWGPARGQLLVAHERSTTAKSIASDEQC